MRVQRVSIPESDTTGSRDEQSERSLAVARAPRSPVYPEKESPNGASKLGARQTREALQTERD